MVKVITYGTYDLFHYGHRLLLERAKALGDYLIVGVTADDFDKKRGKINVQQSLIERIESVRQTGLADEIIVEEYEGQKIDDIKRLGIDIFTVGSDWVGKFDYLNEFCKVVYLPRTEGVSSSQLRSKAQPVKIGFTGDSEICAKYLKEVEYVNGFETFAGSDFDDILQNCKAVYIAALPEKHADMVKKALNSGLNVLCEAPLSMSRDCSHSLFELAKSKGLVLMEAVKTAYSTAYQRMLLLIKTGAIGKVVNVEATCTSLKDLQDGCVDNKQNSMCAWAPTALLPVFQILGTDYKNCSVCSLFSEKDSNFDLFSKIDFIYENSVASVKVGKGVKSEGSLIVSGTTGYIYVPAPWWKTDYFEIRREDSQENKRYFYQLDGEGIRYELVSFRKACESRLLPAVDETVSCAISKIVEDFSKKLNLTEITGV